MVETHYPLVIILLVVIGSISAENVTKVELNDDSNRTWTSGGYPESYKAENQSLAIIADFGYSVLVTIEDLDLDSNSNDFLIIKAGASLEDEGKGKIFVHFLNSSRQYVVHSNNVFMSLQVHGTNEKGRKGFSLKYSRIGDSVSTTTVSPTTASTWPTPLPGDSIYYTGYVAGKTEDDFRKPETLLNFTKAIAEAAAKHCNNSNINLTEAITERNVLVEYLVQCPLNWPYRETCMKVRFSLPILHDNQTYQGYLLDSSHLETMWTRYARESLQKYEMDVYELPNNKATLVKWVVISCIVVILFLVVLYIVKVFGKLFSPIAMARKKANDVFVSSGPKTSVTDSLGPSIYQPTPAFFDNEYSYYEVDIGPPKTKPQLDEFDEDDVDLIMFSNFSNSRENSEVENEINKKEHLS